MSISEFSAAIQSTVYKEWLSKVQSNLVTKTIEELRKGEISSSKTDFLVTKNNLKNIYETLSGSKLDSLDLDVMFAQLAGSLGTSTKTAKLGKKITVEGKDALVFENIGFDTISTVLSRVLDTPEVDENLYNLSLKAQDEAKKALTQKYGKKIPRDEYNKADNIKVSLGDFFDKGHVISLATNLGKQFARQIETTSVLGEKVKAQLLDVLQQYVAKLEADDLASANLPNAITQEVYAKYIKSADKYLVEFQPRLTNQNAGRASLPIVLELRKLFSSIEEEALKNIVNNSSLGKELVFTKGSPSYADLLIKNIVSSITGSKKDKKVYTIPPVKVLSNTIKIIKPKKNTKEIASAKRLISKLKTAKIKNKVPVIESTNVIDNLAALEVLLRDRLYPQIVKNMGTGNSNRDLNFRSGRLARSANIEKITQSREGMISVFYSYMRNPYGTFSEGGRQQYPRTRDPKTLISKSIREIGASIAYNRMRAVLV